MGLNKSVGSIYENYGTMQKQFFQLRNNSARWMEFMKYIKSTAKPYKYFFTTLDITIKVKI